MYMIGEIKHLPSYCCGAQDFEIFHFVCHFRKTIPNYNLIVNNSNLTLLKVHKN